MKLPGEIPRPALLLTPYRMTEQHLLLQALIIKKKNGIPDYERLDMSQQELKRLFPEWPREALVAFTAFGLDAIDQVKKEIRKRHTAQQSGKPYALYFKTAMIRHFQEIMEKIKPYVRLSKWYHTRQLPGQQHYATSACVFSPFRPQLSFEVRKEADGSLLLVTFIDINGSLFELTEFTRYHFLLESKQELFLLSYRQYQILEWLESQDLSRYAFDPAGFSQHILAELDKNYTVHRNDLLDRKVIEAIPLQQVILSELNNTFLMLTPQWSYEGYIVDGPWKEETSFLQEGTTCIVRRDKETEDRFLKQLEALHPDFSKQRNGYFYLSFANAQKRQWFLKTYHQLLTAGIDLLGMDMLKHFRYSPHPAETEMILGNEKNNQQVYRVRLRFGTEEVSLSELQKMLLAGQKAVLLKDGSLGVVGEEWLRKYATLIKHGKVDKDTLTVRSWMTISLKETDESGKEIPLAKAGWWDRWKKWQQTAESVYRLPVTVNATLRPYQQKGYEWMMLLAEAGAGGCLADDMGLGKTLQAICFLAAQVEIAPEAKYLIICPSSLIYNWQQELKKFAPEIRALLFHGSQRKHSQLEDDSIQIIITSYGTLRAEAVSLLQVQYRIAIIDESHNIKNPSAQITQVVSNVRADFCIALSGTPVVNNTFDLYSQLNVVVPGMFGSREFFRREYADAIDRFGDEEKIQLLQQLTAPFILRRTKEQVAADLPAKTESILWCDLTGSQRELYENVKEQIRSSLFLGIKEQGLAKSKLAVIQGILKLRQICNSPLLLPEDERQSEESVKTTVLLEELKNVIPGHKALVFSQFSTMLDLLAVDCRKAGIPFYHFDGQTPPAKRMEMVNAFQSEENTTPLFLISLKAGNAGLNLTAADYVFLFDPWWNTAVQQQAIDRTHRIGQDKKVFAYKLICKDTIEERIIQLQDRKKQLAEDLISADEGFVKKLTEEDISFLFN